MLNFVIPFQVINTVLFLMWELPAAFCTLEGISFATFVLLIVVKVVVPDVVLALHTNIRWHFTNHCNLLEHDILLHPFVLATF